MAKGYWIASIDVTDKDAYGKYAQKVRPYLERCNARFLSRGGDHNIKEGSFRSRNIVIEFESYQDALDCYDSEEYRAMIPLRAGASTGDLVIVEGL